MSPEKLHLTGLDTTPSADIESRLQYETSINHRSRKILYDRYAHPPIGYCDRSGEFLGIDGEIVSALDLEGPETIYDIGCGDGTFTKLLVEKYGHWGKIVGVNNESDHFYPMQQKFASHQNVEFVEGDARNLDLEDESADRVTMNFVPYHLDHPELAISEALRVLKPGGKLLIASRNPGNQKKLWQSAGDIVDELQEMSVEQKQRLDHGEDIPRKLIVPDYSDTKPPQVFYERFDLPRVHEVMSENGLHIIKSYIQSTKEGNSVLRLPDPEGDETAEEAWSWYEIALHGLMSVCRGTMPWGGDYNRAIEKVVKPKFFKEIEERGYFEETVEQGFVVAKKPL